VTSLPVSTTSPGTARSAYPVAARSPLRHGRGPHRAVEGAVVRSMFGPPGSCRLGSGRGNGGGSDAGSSAGAGLQPLAQTGRREAPIESRHRPGRAVGEAGVQAHLGLGRQRRMGRLKDPAVPLRLRRSGHCGNVAREATA